LENENNTNDADKANNADKVDDGKAGNGKTDGAKRGNKPVPTLVVGHRNPDNDSIMSAIGYAYLKNKLDPEGDYRAVRLGPLPYESAWLLEQYGIEPPPVISHVYGRVEDAMTPNPISVDENTTILDAGVKMRDNGIRAIVVTGKDDADTGEVANANATGSSSDASSSNVDSKGARLPRYKGLFSNRMLAEIFISNLDTHESREELLSQKVKDHLDETALVLKPDMLLHDAKEDILNAKLRQAVVLDDDGRCMGIITRTDIARTPHRQVILVDHNESSQAVLGIEEAVVREVVDHHRIGDIQTTTPIQFLGMPIGSTATIVTLEYRRHEIVPPLPIAAMLLSAVMTDTVLLRSPTATPTDREVAEYLGGLLNVNWRDFGVLLFSSRDAAAPPTATSILDADAKEYEFADKTALIVQYETVALKNVMHLAGDLQEEMERRVKEKGYDFILLLLTDVMEEGSQIFVAGNPRAVERSFNIDMGNGSVWVPGILSRKKQVVPNIMQHI
jgi:manganese-dependent inorganic pyrophosphatase